MENKHRNTRDPFQWTHIVVWVVLSFVFVFVIELIPLSPLSDLLQITSPGFLVVFEFNWVFFHLAGDVLVRDGERHQVIDVGDDRHTHEEDQALTASLSLANQICATDRGNDCTRDLENAQNHWNRNFGFEMLRVIKAIPDHSK